MRRLSLLILFAGFAACTPVAGISPDAPAITVRLRNENGANAGRNQVIVTTPATTRVITGTQYDGTLHLPVKEPGVYRVKVIPRDGFLASDSLTRDVTVGNSGRVVVDFTLFRAGCSTSCWSGH